MQGVEAAGACRGVEAAGACRGVDDVGGADAVAATLSDPGVAAPTLNVFEYLSHPIFSYHPR